MTGNLKFYRLAVALIEDYGDDAQHEASARAEMMRALNHDDGHTTWRSVAQVIGSMQRQPCRQH